MNQFEDMMDFQLALWWGRVTNVKRRVFFFGKGAFWWGAFCPYVFLYDLSRTKRNFK